MQAVKAGNHHAILVCVVNRNQLLRTDGDELSQECLNARQDLASKWSHNFVCGFVFVHCLWLYNCAWCVGGCVSHVSHGRSIVYGQKSVLIGQGEQTSGSY